MVHKSEPSNGVPAVDSSTTSILPDNTPEKARAVAAAVTSAPASQARRSGSKKTQVLKLADKGLPAEEIASQLTIPQGEIDLILNLNGRAARC